MNKLQKILRTETLILALSGCNIDEKIGDKGNLDGTIVRKEILLFGGERLTVETKQGTYTINAYHPGIAPITASHYTFKEGEKIRFPKNYGPFSLNENTRNYEFIASNAIEKLKK